MLIHVVHALNIDASYTVRDVLYVPGHPHIVRVIGCVYGAEPLLVLEFCAGGSLKSNLTKARSGKAATPTVPVLTKYGHHVALAMKFLEDHKLMHRDLAVRTII